METKKCTGLRGREYREQNKDLIALRNKKYYREHYDQCNRQNKEYHSTLVGHLRRVFSDIRRRCLNPKCKSFKYYGGRGIENRFESFEEFKEYVINILEVDPRGLQIDRIDNDGHYEENNIRFVTAGINIGNRRNTIKKETSP